MHIYETDLSIMTYTYECTYTYDPFIYIYIYMVFSEMQKHTDLLDSIRDFLINMGNFPLRATYIDFLQQIMKR